MHYFALRKCTAKPKENEDEKNKENGTDAKKRLEENEEGHGRYGRETKRGGKKRWA